MGTEAFRGQFEHGQFGATSQRSKEKYQTKPISSNPWGINGLQFWFRCRGTPGSARRDGSLHRVTVHLRLSAGDPREQPRATTIEGMENTERQNYQTNPISHNPHRFSILLAISEMPGGAEGPGGVHRAGLVPFADPSGFLPPRRYGSAHIRADRKVQRPRKLTHHDSLPDIPTWDARDGPPGIETPPPPGRSPAVQVCPGILECAFPKALAIGRPQTSDRGMGWGRAVRPGDGFLLHLPTAGAEQVPGAARSRKSTAQGRHEWRHGRLECVRHVGKYRQPLTGLF